MENMPVRKSRRRSKVWQFYLPNPATNDRTVFCRICNIAIPRPDGSTTQMHYHIQRKHLNLRPQAGQMVARHQQQLQETERPNLVTGITTDAPVPGSLPSGSDIVTETNEKMLARLRAILEYVPSVGLSCDSWISLANDIFVTVTVHFVGHDERRSACLEVKAFKESPTVENVKDILQHAAQAFNITDKISAVVTKNSESIISAVRALGWKHFPCAVESLNLVVSKALEAVSGHDGDQNDEDKGDSLVDEDDWASSVEGDDDRDKMNEEIAAIAELQLLASEGVLPNLLKRIKSFATNLSYCDGASNALLMASKSLDVPYDKFVQSFPALWITTFDMVERFMEQRPIICNVVTPLDLRLTSLADAFAESEFQALDEVLFLLRPFKDAIMELGANSLSTVGAIIPHYHNLLRQLSRADHLVTTIGLSLHATLKDELQLQYAHYKRSEFLHAAAFLHPSFKTSPFPNEASVKRAKRKVETMLRSVIAEDRGTKAELIIAHTVAAKLLKQYEDAGLEPAYTQVIRYWRTQPEPAFRHLVVKFLCVPAASTPKEHYSPYGKPRRPSVMSTLPPATMKKFLLIDANSWLL